VPVGDMVEAITHRPEHVNVVITGRDAAEELIDIADTVTEMRKVKHAYERGIKGKKGIEF
jgi:cob(I)alamin adenosyltransferase